MPKPYSLDLRERVVSYVEAGHSRRAAAAHLRVSPSFVINLMTAFRKRGAIAPMPIFRFGERSLTTQILLRQMLCVTAYLRLRWGSTPGCGAEEPSLARPV
jgi:transposase